MCGNQPVSWVTKPVGSPAGPLVPGPVTSEGHPTTRSGSIFLDPGSLVGGLRSGDAVTETCRVMANGAPEIRFERR